MLTVTRADVTARLGEVLQLIELIRKSEATPPGIDSMEVRILRGLFFVHLYSVLEFTVNQGVQRFLEKPNTLQAPTSHLKKKLHSLALEPSFSAIRNVGEDKRWQRRLELLEEQDSQIYQRISDGIFGLYLQNVWAERIQIVFDCLGIEDPITSDASHNTYIDELVETRNGVAHGRFSAAGIGSAKRSPELLIRYNAISDTCFHILSCLEQHHANNGAISEDHRSRYT